MASQIKRDGAKDKKESLSSPTLAALASALAFAVDVLLPLLATP